jgi:hypothetical protein
LHQDLIRVAARSPCSRICSRPLCVAGDLSAGPVRFDPATSRGLQEEIVAVGPRQDGNNYQPAGTVLGYTIYVISGVVRSDTATLPAPGPERS